MYKSYIKLQKTKQTLSHINNIRERDKKLYYFD